MPAWRRWLCSAENGFSVIILALLVVLPLLEALARKVPALTITGASSFVQHLTLLIGMAGGALAARDGRLLALSSLPTLLSPKWRAVASVLSSALAAAISVILCGAGWAFIQVEPADKVIVYGIPARFFQSFLPLGFGIVALRLCWNASGRWKGRVLTVLLAAALVWVGWAKPVEPAKLVWPAMALLLAATVFGAPLFTTLGGAAMILLWGNSQPVALIPLEHYYLVTDAVLPSLPLFTMAGYFLAEGGASKRLVHVFDAWLGPFRGGPGIVTVLVCAFFTSFTGASGVTILALGGLLMPVLIQARYSEKSALGLVTGAGSLGLLFPPCLPLILYAVIAQRTLQNLEMPDGKMPPEISINQLFLGGFGPGVLLVLLTAWWAIRAGPREKAQHAAFDLRTAMAAVWGAKWELMLPVLALGAMFTGLATPVEAAAVSALLCLPHADGHLSRSSLSRMCLEC